MTCKTIKDIDIEMYQNVKVFDMNGPLKTWAWAWLHKGQNIFLIFLIFSRVEAARKSHVMSGSQTFISSQRDEMLSQRSEC